MKTGIALSVIMSAVAHDAKSISIQAYAVNGVFFCGFRKRRQEILDLHQPPRRLSVEIERSHSMIRQMLLSIPVALAVGFSAQVACQENKIPDQAREILEKAMQFELLSIGDGASTKNPPEDFHGWHVIGKTTIKDPDARKRLVAALEKGVVENKGDSMKCFDPRHGIRVIHDGTTADFVICFQCFQGLVYVAGRKEHRFLITDSPAPVFNQTLRDAKIPLATKPGKKN